MARRGKPEAARVTWTPHASVLARRERPPWVEAARRSAVGGTVAAILILLGRREMGGAVALISLAFVVLAALAPSAYRAVDRFFAKASGWVGRGLAYLVLAPVFFLVITPLRLLLRTGARARWRSGRDPSAASYW